MNVANQPPTMFTIQQNRIEKKILQMVQTNATILRRRVSTFVILCDDSKYS